MTKSLPARFGFVCAIAIGVGFAMPASAQEGVTVKSILGKMGIVPDEKDQIHYRERAPLVLPPKTGDLRTPSAPADYQALNPNWPTDPDVAAKRRREADARVPAGQSDIRRMSENNPRLTPGELSGGRTARVGGGPAPGWGRNDDARDVLYLSPDQLRAGRPGSQSEKDDDVTLAQRRTLVDPPVEYRKSAQGKRIEAVQADPKIDQQARDANPLNWIREQFGGSKDEDEF